MAISKDKIDVVEGGSPTIALETTVHNDGSEKHREVVNIGSPDNGGGAGAMAEVLVNSHPAHATDAGLIVRPIPNADIETIVTQGTAAAVGSGWPVVPESAGGNQIAVDGSGIQSVALANAEFLEDDAAAGGESGVHVLGVRKDADTSPVDADGDFQSPIFDARGAMKVEVFSGETLSALISNDDLLSTKNSSAATLSSAAAFTGDGDDCIGYTAVTVQLFADQASAADGMKFQFSTNNSNWDDTYSFSMTASDTRRFQFAVTARYFRVFYTNGGTNQGAFRVQTILHRQNVLTSIHRIVDDESTDRSA